jgi:DNA-binding NarL/FixJ family response regulator
MQKPEDVSEILHLHQKGFGSRRIVEELGIGRKTVKRSLRQGGWAPSHRPEHDTTEAA